MKAPLCFATALAACLGLATPGARSQAAGAEPATALPLSEVILYSSGVGYFARAGEVEGQARVDLRFKVDDINDLLKSLVVQDLDGGQVTAVGYGSRDPLTKTLRTFGIDLTANPGLGDLLNQARGERAEVSWPSQSAGTIVGIEKRKIPAGENRTVDAEYLNLLTDQGLQSIPLSQVQRIQLTNPRLNSELRQALEVLASGHDTLKKTVSIQFDGTGKRKVRVAYIAQAPVWKTSYRLVLGEKETFLQGWAIIENTTDEDWKDVRLSMVSGVPISFTMDLYQPLYSTRPVVEPERQLALQPQVYSLGLEAKDANEPAMAMAPPPPAALGQRLEMLATRAGAAAKSSMRGLAAGAAGDRMGFQGGTAPTLDADTMARAAAAGTAVGELFHYVIQTPVSVARQNSAMLPIVSEKVEAEKVSIYNASVHAKHPLNGVRLKNTTPLHLMRGPITVFDSNAYAGDARIDDLPAGQNALLSYALDVKVEVEPQTGDGQQQLTSVKIQKGTLIAVNKLTETRTYNVKNRDGKSRRVLIEHPFRSDWQLAQPKEATERARDVYRFALSVDPDKSTTLKVDEERTLSSQVALAETDFDTIAFYLRQQRVSAQVKEALQKVAQLREKIDQTVGERSRREQRIGEITSEQARIRENMGRLAQNSELYVRYVKKFDQQETELDQIRTEIETLKTTEARQRQELGDYMGNLELE